VPHGVRHLPQVERTPSSAQIAHSRQFPQFS
jgi:hypothetical protein